MVVMMALFKLNYFQFWLEHNCGSRGDRRFINFEWAHRGRIVPSLE
jgi:hypothetical protein